MDKNILIVALTTLAQRTFLKELLTEKGFNVPERVLNYDGDGEQPLLCVNLLNKVAVPIIESLVYIYELKNYEFLDFEDFVVSISDLESVVPNEKMQDTEVQAPVTILEMSYQDDDDNTLCKVSTMSDDKIFLMKGDETIVLSGNAIQELLDMHNSEMDAYTSRSCCSDDSCKSRQSEIEMPDKAMSIESIINEMPEKDKQLYKDSDIGTRRLYHLLTFGDAEVCEKLGCKLTDFVEFDALVNS
jgi:hypothetical protein